MNDLILVLLVPFFAACLTALLNGYARLERAISLVACAGLTAFVFRLLWIVDHRGPQVTMLGDFAAPYGIAFVADRLASIMLCLSMSVGTVVLLYTFATVREVQQRHFFYPFFHLLILGVNWSFITGDLFNLFVAYEVMLIGSYGAMTVGASRQQIHQAMTYVALNLLGGALFVVGLGLVYATVGTLNMADLVQRTAALQGSRAAVFTAASTLLLLVFALKAGIFPIFFWLPDSYPVVPPGVNGYFAGLLTKVGIYSLLRVFVMTFRQPGHEIPLEILLTLSGFTMLLGVLGAICQWEIRRILSWHIISQVGYMVMGIGLAATAGIAHAAIAATIFYVVHHIIVKSSLFLVGGIAEEVTGERRLRAMGGTLTLAPFAATLFLIPALSLAGLPPFSGFFSKLVLVRAALEGGSNGIVAIAMVTSFFTLFSMLKIWTYGFWGSPRVPEAEGPWHGMAAATAVLVAFTVCLGAWPEPFLRLASDAADDILQPRAYVQAVLDAPGDGRPVAGGSR